MPSTGTGIDWRYPLERRLTFARLPEVSQQELLAHMSDPRVGVHMPLLTSSWDLEAVQKFVATKEELWRRDGLGHWAILCDGAYVGWGGFQKEGEEWDFGLVLRPDAFGLGTAIAKKAIAFAKSDDRIPFITFLLPPSRKNLAALGRLGAAFVGEIEYEGAKFRKYRLDTA